MKPDELTVRHLSHERFGAFMHWLPGSGGADGEAGVEATCVLQIVHPEAGRAPFYAKFYPDLGGQSRALANEIAGYVLAKHFHIEQPPRACVFRAPLKRLDLRRLPPRHAWLKTLATQTDFYPAFCTQAVQAPTPWLFYGGQAASAMCDDLRAWPDCAKTLAFDDIITNLDRNLRNLLRIGQSRYAIIDHGRLVAPDGNWVGKKLDPDMKSLNKLLDILYPKNRAAIGNAVAAAADQNALLLIGLHEIRHWLSHLLPKEEQEAFDSFLKVRTINAPQRIPSHLHLLL